MPPAATRTSNTAIITAPGMRPDTMVPAITAVPATMAGGTRPFTCGRRARPGRCPTSATPTKARGVTAPVTGSGSSGEPCWVWLDGPKIQPVLQLDGLRLIGAGPLLENCALLLVRILRGELGVLRAQPEKESFAFHCVMSRRHQSRWNM